MSKAVVCFLIAAAFVLVVVLSANSKPNHKHGQSRRLGSRILSPIFDPIVTKVQRIEEEKASNNEAGSRTHLEEEDKKYFYNDGTLNMRLRLMVLFPVLDVAPHDGMLDAKELQAWLTQQAIDRLHYRTRRELELRDKDGDGAISFFEYLPQFNQEDIGKEILWLYPSPPFYGQPNVAMTYILSGNGSNVKGEYGTERNDTRHGEAGWWIEQFRNADTDRNGTLNLYEFRDFLHPEDSRNEHIQKWLLKEKIRQMDKDNDKKLNFGEFETGAYNTYKTYLEYETTGGESIPIADDAFAKLDVDKDKLLRVEELKPLIQYLNPGELVYAKYHLNYLIREADEDGDGKLTLDEMLNHEHIFYNSLYDNGKDEDEYYVYHDEL